MEEMKDMRFEEIENVEDIEETEEETPRNSGIADFLNFAEKKGLHIKTLHTSGHADKTAFDTLIGTVKPQYILPIHTENPTWFERYEGCKIIYENSFEGGLQT